MNIESRGQAFLKKASLFQLGDLVTEQPHQLTMHLSEQAQGSLPDAIEVLRKVDFEALKVVEDKGDFISELVKDIRETWNSGGRVFLSGCGATGRLSISLEGLARQGWLPEDAGGRIIGFMAGGDAAFIRSIEGFEDYPEYGARQLAELGVGERDLLIAITEGGETPFVIGTVHEALRKSSRSPWFVYCNPDDILCQLVERSREVIENPGVKKLNLTVGPMAITGSTRMQASTVQMLAVGLALEAASHGDASLIQSRLAEFQRLYETTEFGFLASYVEAESQIYRDGNFVLYQTDKYGLTVLTDTTERAPTFSLIPFENVRKSGDSPSWCYLSLHGRRDSKGAWETLLGRKPRSLEWEACAELTGMQRILGFDISEQALEHRRQRCEGHKQYPFQIYGEECILEFAGLRHLLCDVSVDVLFRNLLLKCCLNIHSTLVMGRLGRYEGNVMTYVKPSNGKLIDRAARYVQYLGQERKGKEISYEEAVKAVFEVQKNLPADEPVVLRALEKV